MLGQCWGWNTGCNKKVQLWVVVPILKSGRMLWTPPKKNGDSSTRSTNVICVYIISVFMYISLEPVGALSPFNNPGPFQYKCHLGSTYLEYLYLHSTIRRFALSRFFSSGKCIPIFRLVCFLELKVSWKMTNCSMVRWRKPVGFILEKSILTKRMKNRNFWRSRFRSFGDWEFVENLPGRDVCWAFCWAKVSQILNVQQVICGKIYKVNSFLEISIGMPCILTGIGLALYCEVLFGSCSTKPGISDGLFQHDESRAFPWVMDKPFSWKISSTFWPLGT